MKNVTRTLASSELLLFFGQERLSRFDIWSEMQYNTINIVYKEGCDFMFELEEASLALKEFEKKLKEFRDSL